MYCSSGTANGTSTSSFSDLPKGLAGWQAQVLLQHASGGVQAALEQCPCTGIAWLHRQSSSSSLCLRAVQNRGDSVLAWE